MATVCNDRERHKIVPLSGGYHPVCHNPPSNEGRVNMRLIPLAGGQNSSVPIPSVEGSASKHLNSPSSLAVRTRSGSLEKNRRDIYRYFTLYIWTVPFYFLGQDINISNTSTIQTYIHYTIYIVIYNSTLEESCIYII